MKSRYIQNYIDDLRNLSGLDFAVTDPEGTILASTTVSLRETIPFVRNFVQSSQNQLTVGQCGLFRAGEPGSTSHVLAVYGEYENKWILGRAAASGLRHMEIIYRKEYEKPEFFRELILGNLLREEIWDLARKLHLDPDEKRIAVLVEGQDPERVSLSPDRVRELFHGRSGVVVIGSDRTGLLLIRSVPDRLSVEDREKLGKEIADVVGSAERSPVRAACGDTADSLTGLPASWREAEFALKTGKIFYPDQKVYVYGNLGLGELVAHFSENACRRFLEEMPGHDYRGEPDPELLHTLEVFLDSGLNETQASRRLYISRNTLQYRLMQVKRKSGLDLRNFNDAARMKLALMICRLPGMAGDQEEWFRTGGSGGSG